MKEKTADTVTSSMSSQEPAFTTFWLKDTNPLSGNIKRRMISSPNDQMRRAHASLIQFIRRQNVFMPSSTACMQGDSSLKNVLRHRKLGSLRSFNRYFFLTDLVSAYKSVSLNMMSANLVQAAPELRGRETYVEEFLRVHCFDPRLGGLVTGGPASPDLFNLYAEIMLDCHMRFLCEKYGLTYTRYLDDLTFSSTKPIGYKKRQAIRQIIEEAGFDVNDRKTKVYDLRKGPIVVNGVGICLYGRIFLPRGTLRHIKGLLHIALMKGKVAPAVIHGKMGLLKFVTQQSNANKTEQKVFEMYDEFRRMQAMLKPR